LTDALRALMRAVPWRANVVLIALVTLRRPAWGVLVAATLVASCGPEEAFAPNAIGAVSLEPYLGRCRVVHAIGRGPLVRPVHLAHALAGLPPRVLVRTYARMPQQRFDQALPAFAPETLEQLADAGVRLVGIDSASVDPADSKTLEAHQVLRRRGLRVLENLLLDDVPEGDYELIALPLKLTTACASPVRAVLRELP
jgi:arylformamidase